MEQLLKVDDTPVVLVIAIQPIGAANSLEEIVVVYFIIEIDVGTRRGIKACEQLADHDQ